MTDYSLARMNNIRSEFKTFKNPNNEQFASPEWYRDLLWHWMTRVMLLSRQGEGTYSKEDLGEHWRGAILAVPFFSDLGHFIEIKKSLSLGSTSITPSSLFLGRGKSNGL